ncbi:FkbM family methyltransferase [Desulfocurvibacter africanus]|uniref:Methyltransferase FkbM family n=1 Tax=Desulfocurvibacter africanus subsp. africanus str. Walvis Bay TaxID=690850 RepID=F3YUT7_DESAF|nr:FkbM family methyltransferase [Desulfocurvibacter africanus]EGJ49114.1 methyltransferase FkbM family [Desulfocurvibacter africanus subsp. africanus str. Walvis Bay]
MHIQTASSASFVQVTHRYKSEVLRLTVPKGETFLVGDIFLREEYPLTKLKGVFGHTVVLDIGANVGLFAIYARLNIPNSTVHSFEPSGALRKAFEINAAPFTNIHLHPVALSDHDGEQTLYFNANKTGQSSLKPGQEPAGPALVNETVRVRDAGKALDGLQLDSVDILKVDTEGSEIEILKSFGSRLDRVKHVYLEYHSEADREEIHELLADFTLLEHFKRGETVGILKYMNSRL